MNTRSHNSLAQLLVTSSAVDSEAKEANLAAAEDHYREVINDHRSDSRSKRYASNNLGRLLSSKRYRYRNLYQRPDFVEAVKVLEGSFESSEQDRNDDCKKSFHDVVTHNITAKTYLEWSEDDGLTDADKQTYLQKANHHFERSFRNLPNENLRSPEVEKHALKARDEYTRFLWIKMQDNQAADEAYADNIAWYETLGSRYASGYKLYLHYGRFIYDTEIEQSQEQCRDLMHKGVGFETEIELSQEKYRDLMDKGLRLFDRTVNKQAIVSPEGQDQAIDVYRMWGKFGRFLWKDVGDVAAAAEEYEAMVQSLERIGPEQMKSYKLFYYYASFIYQTNMIQSRRKYVALMCSAIHLAPTEEERRDFELQLERSMGDFLKNPPVLPEKLDEFVKEAADHIDILAECYAQGLGWGPIANILDGFINEHNRGQGYPNLHTPERIKRVSSVLRDF